MLISSKIRLSIVGGLIVAMMVVSVPAGVADPVVPDRVISGAVTANSNVFVAADPSLGVSGGKTQIKKHWWGFAVFLNSDDSAVVIAGGKAAARLLSRIGLPGKIVSIILAIGVGVLSACKGKNGIYIHAAWVGPSWCKHQ
jgi:hypothetical protein